MVTAAEPEAAPALAVTTTSAAAEGFRQHLGHSYPQNNVLAELLGKA
ncbi:unnamed protein product [Gemmataceae bacterium]|nr:unnamed protein product [Gemmataceae bacterium]VTU01787.1 unnamed protein product [Gemmataceae bacterium]